MTHGSSHNSTLAAFNNKLIGICIDVCNSGPGYHLVYGSEPNLVVHPSGLLQMNEVAVFP